ncbi:hypothetical protein SLEP1_g46131 [Rubroshorea leprosula]|uniref:Uncharacterized protein n=1 Tax=Rubroshorea leprosula TaxID=152421 RepID=A0AAV5LL98_9ROSI|nr:hypothetical protein SLEP1_g46131 [Rubroshorea leprosula]
MKKLKRTILEIRPVFSSGKVHLDVIEGLALAEVVVIGSSEEVGLVAKAPGCEPKLLVANSRVGFLTNPARGFAPREPRLLGANPQAGFERNPSSWVRTRELGSS